MAGVLVSCPTADNRSVTQPKPSQAEVPNPKNVFMTKNKTQCEREMLSRFRTAQASVKIRHKPA